MKPETSLKLNSLAWMFSSIMLALIAYNYKTKYEGILKQFHEYRERERHEPVSYVSTTNFYLGISTTNYVTNDAILILWEK